MLFNSINFAFFFPIIFIVYWFILKKNHNWQNFFLMIASYFFYACWDWRFMFLLAFSTLLDYFCGLKIFSSQTKKAKKIWLFLCAGINIGFLGFFKYYNFFIESFQDLLLSFGLTPHLSTLQIILPVGISFYTFHGLSYVLDIYNEKIEPRKNIVNYSLFVSFFPLLVAGPIERARHLLPQIEKPRTFDYEKAKDGSKQILWGLFKKIVVADGCAQFVDIAFNNTETTPGWFLCLAAIFFAFQIYGDFSGYTDIALGVARLLGFELLQNFNFPYFSRDIAEFWRRWHISLSSWFKDYLYIPLGGSKGGMIKTIRNTFIIFLVSGFWHGANWTYLAWGGLHACYMVPLIIRKKNRINVSSVVAEGNKFPSLKEIGQLISTFILITIAWIFFRADSVSHAFIYIKSLLTNFKGHDTFGESIMKFQLLICIFFCIFMLFFEWIGRKDKHALANSMNKWKTIPRYAFYYLLVLILFFFAGNAQNFIYFQF